MSVKSSEESVANSFHALESVLEEGTFSDSTSSMSMDAHVSETQEYSMAFNMRLEFSKTNTHGAQIYKDPLGRWVVKIEDNPTTLETAPFVNYQGELYMGQNGERYVVTKDPDNVDKWGQLVKESEAEGPPFGDSDDPKLINTLKVRYIPIDEPNIALYVRDLEDSQGCYFTKNPASHTVQQNKTLYVYLEGMMTMSPHAIFVDTFGIRYEIMEPRLAQNMTWQGFPIPDLAPRTASSSGGERISRDNSQKRYATEVSRAPPMHSTFEPRRVEPSAREVPSRPTTSHKPTLMTNIKSRTEGSGQLPRKTSTEHRKVRPANFQKWVKKYNGAGDPYDHLASFKQIARAEQVTDLHKKVEGFGLTLEGRALS